MRVTTFIAGMAIGALAGMYIADRRSLATLQSKLQLAGNVVTDVVDMAKDKVMDTAFTVMTGSNGHSNQNQNQSQAQSPSASSTSGQQTSSSTTASNSHGTINLDRIKDLIQRDPELKKQVDAIIHECSVDSGHAANQKSDAQKTASSTSTKTSASSTSTQPNHH